MLQPNLGHAVYTAMMAEWLAGVRSVTAAQTYVRTDARGRTSLTQVLVAISDNQTSQSRLTPGSGSANDAAAAAAAASKWPLNRSRSRLTELIGFSLKCLHHP